MYITVGELAVIVRMYIAERGYKVVGDEMAYCEGVAELLSNDDACAGNLFETLYEWLNDTVVNYPGELVRAK